jgi:hypothetical protein
MLAGTAPNAFIMDIEGRASHAGCHYVVPQQNAKGFDEIAEVLEAMKRCPLQADGTINFQGYKVGTIVLDTVDHLQALLKTRYADMSNKQRMYGLLLDGMMNRIVWPLMAIPVNIVLIMHTKNYGEGNQDDGGKKDPKGADNGTCPRIDLALEGDLRNKLMRYFDSVLHLVVTQSGEHKIVTSPRVIDGRFLVAKDTLWLLRGETIGLTWKDGRLESTVLTTIFDTLMKAQGQQATTAIVKSEWISAAIARGIMENASDAEGAMRLKELLGPTYEALTTARGSVVMSLKEEGLQKIDACGPASGEARKAPA